MKHLLAALVLALSLTAFARAQATNAPAADPVAQLTKAVQDLQKQSAETDKELQDLQKQVATLTDRLGKSYEPASPFNSIEKRFDDLKKRMDRLESDMRRLQDSVTRLDRKVK